MILTGILLMILLFCIGFLFAEGMWSNVLRFLTVVAFALLATNYFEPVADQLDAWMPSYTYCWDFVALWGLFAVFVSLFRAITDQLSKVKVRFPAKIDQVGSVVFSGGRLGDGLLHPGHAAHRAAGREILFRLLSVRPADVSGVRVSRPGVAEFCEPHVHGRVVPLRRRGKAETAFRPEVPGKIQRHPQRRGSPREQDQQHPPGRRREAADLPDAARHPAGDQIAAPKAMCEPHAAPPRLSDTQDADMARYHPLSSLAVAGLVLGLLSALAVLGPLLWIIPAAGAVTSGAALWRISRPAAQLAGRRLAQCGLLLSIALGTTVQVDTIVYRFLVRREARQFAALWFGYLLARPPQPQKAYQLTLPPRFRQPLDEQLGDFYRRNPHRHESLDDYLQTPLVRKLLALGPAAEARCQASEHQVSSDEGEAVELLYAVTHSGRDGPTTLLVNLGLTRFKLDNGRANWQVTHAEEVTKGEGDRS